MTYDEETREKLLNLIVQYKQKHSDDNENETMKNTYTTDINNAPPMIQNMPMNNPLYYNPSLLNYQNMQQNAMFQGQNMYPMFNNMIYPGMNMMPGQYPYPEKKEDNK